MPTNSPDLKIAHSASFAGRWKRLLWLLPVLIAAVLIFFPFDWPGDVWPAYEFVFERVFATVLAHEIGHATVFFLAGTLLLLSFPGLHGRPGRYFGAMAAAALGEEFIQSLFKLSVPSIWDGRDLLLDLCGFTLAYGLGMAWARLRKPRAGN